MDWTVRWFEHKIREWETVKCGAETAYLKAYAMRQVEQWESLRSRAQQMFKWAKETTKEERKRKKGPSGMVPLSESLEM
jgi:hypothetical protein